MLCNEKVSKWFYAKPWLDSREWSRNTTLVNWLLTLYVMEGLDVGKLYNMDYTMDDHDLRHANQHKSHHHENTLIKNVRR
ncbi:hypothetical protein P8452_10439 [Trifolium repens]|nr:hypothetical protein P8452_10439 [Trifolium repens]